MQDHLLDARGFLLRRSHVGSFFENHVHKGWEGSPHEYLQAASQEPDASFLSRGAASTAQCYGLKLVRWVGKPQGRANSFSAYWNQVSGHSGGDPCIAFSPDGTRVVSGSGDQLVKIWNSETGAEVVNPDCLDLGAGKVTSIAFSSDGKRVVSGSREGLVKIWNAANGAEVCTLAGHSDEVCSVAFSSDGTRVFTSTDEGCVKIWDAERGAEVCTLPGQHEGGVWSAAVSSDGKRVVIGTDDLVKIFNAETGAEVCSLEGHQGPVRAVAFSSDAKRIASGELHGSVKIWNAETGEKVRWCLLLNLAKPSHPGGYGGIFGPILPDFLLPYP
ncbi:quinon protein alcohol dehydrogenase-like superfamily [Baffinella frigidus]|nr:quinon protein alcohol dehydrogenase-like superfamily [Cryptophyta sp. CCMP2293]